MDPLYLDNGATSWPKPPEVARAMADFLSDVGASPGRAGHRLALEAGRIVYDTREALAEFFGLKDPMRVVFTSNVTEALNLVLRGLLIPGDRVIVSSMEHNAVMRPLRFLEQQGVTVENLPCDAEGRTDPRELELALEKPAKLVVVNHASNVTGTVQPLGRFGAVVRQRRKALGTQYPLFLVDTAQSAGSIPIDMEHDGVDILVFTGHKGLLGPTGTGGALFGPYVPVDTIKPLIRGGTGSRSERETQPEFLPDRFESGTMNSVGLAGLLAALTWIRGRGVVELQRREAALSMRLYEALAEMKGIRLYGPDRRPGFPLPEAGCCTGILSFNIDGMPCSEAGMRLDEEYGILCRVGLHCAPSAHRSIGTFPEGTIRFGVGPFTNDGDIDRAVDAVSRLSGEVQ